MEIVRQRWEKKKRRMKSNETVGYFHKFKIEQEKNGALPRSCISAHKNANETFFFVCGSKRVCFQHGEKMSFLKIAPFLLKWL